MADTTTNLTTTRSGEYHVCGKCGNDLAECIQAERDDERARIRRRVEERAPHANSYLYRDDVLAAIDGGDDD